VVWYVADDEAIWTHAEIVVQLGLEAAPFAAFFLVPTLGRMSDPQVLVRQLATSCFAALLRVAPLEAGLPDPVGLSADLLALRQSERRFLQQLTDGSKIDHYDIPIPIHSELRTYVTVASFFRNGC
jgi:TATA-binding protein-associated factor